MQEGGAKNEALDEYDVTVVLFVGGRGRMDSRMAILTGISESLQDACEWMYFFTAVAFKICYNDIYFYKENNLPVGGGG